MKYNKYNTQIQVKNTKTISHITLYSEEFYTEDEFKNIILDIVNKYRDELILYDLWELYTSNIIKDYNNFKNLGDSIGVLGEHTYPNKYKYVDTKKLIDYVLKDYPQFSENPELDCYNFKKIIVE